jgi:hypothetical protein
MAEYSWNHGAGGWVRRDRGNRPVGPWRTRRLDRQRLRLDIPPPPPEPGGPMGAGDRVPRRPNDPLPSLAAEVDLPVS